MSNKTWRLHLRWLTATSPSSSCIISILETLDFGDVEIFKTRPEHAQERLPVVLSSGCCTSGLDRFKVGDEAFIFESEIVDRKQNIPCVDVRVDDSMSFKA